MIYLLTLKVDVARHNNALITIFDKISKSWWKVMPNVWLIDTHLTADEVYTGCKSTLIANDNMFVIRVADDYSGIVDSGVWKWLTLSSKNKDF